MGRSCGAAKTALHACAGGVLLFAAYLWFLAPFLLDPGVIPGKDNLKYLLPHYLYCADSIRLGFGFPSWYPWRGGVPVDAAAIPFLPLLPHRLLGTLLYLPPLLGPVGCYKLTLVVGMSLSAWGCWLFLSELTGCRRAAFIGCLMLLFGGTGITVLHQEQLIAAMTWLPWSLLALLRSVRRPGYLLVCAACCGAGMATFYPHIQLLALLFALLGSLPGGGMGGLRAAAAKAGNRTLLLCGVLFLAGASPVLLAGGKMSDFVSPLRGGESLGAGSLAEYLKLNSLQRSSAEPAALSNYARFRAERDDDGAFFVTLTGLTLAGAGLLLRGREALPLLLVFLLSVWASLGVRGGFAQLLFLGRFPFIGAFRQWYHFVPVANMALCGLGALGASAIISRLGKRAGAGVLVAAAALMFWEGRAALGRYSSMHLPRTGRTILRPDRGTFLRRVKEGGYSEPSDSVLLMYREFAALSAERAGLPLDAPFIPPGRPGGDARPLPEGFVVTPQGASLSVDLSSAAVVVFPFSCRLGLSARTNGKSAEISPAYPGALAAVRVPPGRSEIELSVPGSALPWLTALPWGILAGCLLLGIPNGVKPWG